MKSKYVIPPPAITVKNAFLSFDGVVLFENLNLNLQAGKCTCLLGPSGVGKSTLLRLIANLSSRGTIIRAEVSADNQMNVPEQVAYMAQTDLLMPWLSVLDNVLLGSRLRNTPWVDQFNLKQKAKELLGLVGLQNAEKVFPKNLSGGMRQRTALIRTLMEDKPVILMDEPFSALDAITRYKLQNLAGELLRDKTILFVTHDPQEALRLADVIFIMAGQPAALRNPFKLNSPTPRDVTSAELLSLQNILFEELRKAHDQTFR